MTEQRADFTLAELAEWLDADLIPASAGSDVVSGVGTLENAEPGQLSFLNNKKYVSALKSSKASVVLLAQEYADQCPVPALVCKDPYLAYARISQRFQPAVPAVSGVHASAVIDDSADVHESASIGPNCVVGANAIVGANCIVGAGCVIERDCKVGAGSVLRPNVTLLYGTVVGERALLHPGVVIGADGFGIAWSGAGWEKIAQLGSVVLGDDVEVGANSTIDRGAIENTEISNSVKIDNLVQIGHNCKVGQHTAIAGHAGIAGSSEVGAYCLIGGQVGISGHLKIADQVVMMQDNGVLSSISEPGHYSMGYGAQPAASLRRTAIRLKKLDELSKTVRRLEKQLAAMDEKS